MLKKNRHSIVSENITNTLLKNTFILCFKLFEHSVSEKECISRKYKGLLQTNKKKTKKSKRKMGKIYEQALHRRNKWPIHIFHSMFLVIREMQTK